MYGTEKEPVLGNAPKHLGSEFIIRAYLDASFAGCKLTKGQELGSLYFSTGLQYFTSPRNKVQARLVPLEVNL